MIRYQLVCPGGEGFIARMIRLWWFLVHHYHTSKWFLAQSIHSQSRHLLPTNEIRSGEIAVITGGSRGIGAGVVKRLLQCDMHVVIGCRNRHATNEMVKGLRRKGVTSGTVEAIDLDLTSLNSIREFAFKILKKSNNLSVLVNNAGILSSTYGLTVEGLEQHFQVNYLGHVLLTFMLLPKLHASSTSGHFGRIVNVTSVQHYGAYPDLNDMQMRDFYSPEKSFMDSKLLLLAFSNFLNRRLIKISANVRSFSVHPGFVNTQKSPPNGGGPLRYLFYERVDQSAEAIAYVALSAQLEMSGGGLFMHGNQTLQPHPLCDDLNFQNNLWSQSCELLDLKADSLGPIDDTPGEEGDGRNGLKAPHIMSMDLDLKSRLTDCNRNKSFWRHSFSLSSFSNSTSLLQPPEYNVKPYYEYFISGLFSQLNLHKLSSAFAYLELLSIFVIRRIDRINSHLKLI